MKTKEERLLGYIKVVFLCALVVLVFANTVVLAMLFPIVGHHLMPDNLVAAEAWKSIIMIMQACMCAVIMSLVGYVIVKVMKWKGREGDIKNGILHEK